MIIPTVKTDVKPAILEQLSYGRENAITGAILAKRLELRSTREMRQIIKQLRHEGKLIGLSIRPPYGYYLISTAEELKECMATLKGYCVEAAIARRNLKLAAPVLFQEIQRQKFYEQHPGQLNLL